MRVLLDSPPMESTSPARGGASSVLGHDHPASHINPFIMNENSPYNHSNSSGIYATSARGVLGPGAAASQTALSFADPPTQSGPTEFDASSQYFATGRSMADYGRVDESQIDASTALASPPAYSEVDSSGSSNVSRLPNPHGKHGLRVA